MRRQGSAARLYHPGHLQASAVLRFSPPLAMETEPLRLWRSSNRTGVSPLRGVAAPSCLLPRAVYSTWCRRPRIVSGSPSDGHRRPPGSPCCPHSAPHPDWPGQGSSRPTVVSPVGTAGFEPAASCSPSTRSAKLSHVPLPPLCRSYVAWSGRPGSNRRPPGPKPGARPAALRPVSKSLCQLNPCRC